MCQYDAAKSEPASLWFKVNSIRLHALRWEGVGLPVILLHGTGLLARLWEPMARELAGQIGPVYAFDLRGHGLSEKPVQGYRWQVFAEDIAAASDQLGNSHSIIIGHSMGGTVGFILAAMRPDLVSRLVAIEPVVRKPQALADASKDPQVPTSEKARRRRAAWNSYEDLGLYLRTKVRYASWRPEILNLFARFGTEQDPNGKISLLCRPEIEAEMYLDRQLVDPWTYFPKITCDTLLVYNDKKRSEVMADPEEVAKAIGRARIVRQHGGHFLPYEQPQALLDVVRSFLLAEEENP